MSAPESWRTLHQEAPWTRMQLDLVVDEASTSSAELYRYSLRGGLSFRSRDGWLSWRPAPLSDRVAVEERIERIEHDWRSGHVDQVASGFLATLGAPPERAVPILDLGDRPLAHHALAAAREHRRNLRWQFVTGGACGLAVGMLGVFVRDYCAGSARPAVIKLLAAARPLVAPLAGGGDRSIGPRIDEPTLADCSWLARRAACLGPPSEIRADPADAVGAELAGTTRRITFWDALSRARRNYVVADAALTLTRRSGARVRAAVLEVGRRLEARGSLERGSDVLHLSLREALSALVEPPGAESPNALTGPETPFVGHTALRRCASARRAHHDRVRAAGAPAVPEAGDDLESVSPAWLASIPDEVARCVDAMHWTRQALGGGAGPPGARPPGAVAVPDAGALAGHGVGGRTIGRVRIADSVEDVAGAAPGDVLVCRGDDVGALALLAAPGALVTEAHGVLGRNEVLALRRGFPAVVGVPDARARLRGRATAVVDGRTGRIEAWS